MQEAAAVLRQLAGQRPSAPTHLQRAELAKLRHSLREVAAPRSGPALRGRQRARRPQYGVVTALFAVLGLVLAAWGLWWRPAVAHTRYATLAGEQRQVTLPDGSLVLLNGNSTLTLAATWQPGQAREVWLVGEGYFRVQHTAPARVQTVAGAAPNVKFTVHAGPLDVAVLGTQFNVFNRVGKTRVVLTTGQIQLSHRLNGQVEQLVLAPGELVEYSAAAPRAPLAKRPAQGALYTAWASGQLDFDNTPVPEIMALLQDTYGLRITLANPALARQKLSGSVPTADLDVLLRSVGKSMDAKVRRQGQQVWFE